MNVKSVETSNQLRQSLLGLQIYPNFAQNSESESFTGKSSRINSKVDFNVIRGPRKTTKKQQHRPHNNILGLITTY